jgi:signal transduction histidine kinase
MHAETLNEAFQSFTEASKSLETYYGLLQQRVRYLTIELEKKNKELQDALAEAEKHKDFLNAVLYNLEEAIIVIDPQERITMMNRSGEGLLGVSSKDVTGAAFGSLALTILREGSDTFLLAKGNRYSIILSTSSVVDSAGSVRGRVILMKDITRLRQLEIHHERNQRLIAMGEMAAKIVHELRNPLCSIELFASMLESELTDPAHRDLARGISTGIGNLNAILTNMLFFARPHTPSMKMISLNRVVEESLAILSPLMETRHVKIRKSIIEGVVRGDAELLKQVFVNIFMNAAQSMPEGGTIEVSMHADRDALVVVVRDMGIGIPPEHLEKIFDPFFSTKDNGTGLGLAISSKIMQAHNGRIRVESESGKGSTFSLFFDRDAL